MRYISNLYYNLSIPVNFIDNIKEVNYENYRNVIQELQPVLPPSPPEEVRRYMGGGDDIMARILLLQRDCSIRINNIQEGNEQFLENLAYDIIMKEYGSIIKDHAILDIKLTNNPTSDFECDECSTPPPKEYVEDDRLKLEIDKRKIANNITQGESKNSHRYIHLQEVREELNRVDPQLFNYYDKLLKINEVIEWKIPIPDLQYMWVNNPSGIAGMCNIEWPEDEDDDEEERNQKIADEANQEVDFSQQDEEELDNYSNLPKIKVRGVDFPMLLHEAIKGINELIMSKGIPEDNDLANNVIQNTDNYNNEIEDLKYGNYISSSISKYILNFEGTDSYPVVFHFVKGELISRDAEDFIRIMKGIFQENENQQQNNTVYNPDEISLDEELQNDFRYNYEQYARDIIGELVEEKLQILREYDMTGEYHEDEDEDEEDDDQISENEENFSYENDNNTQEDSSDSNEVDYSQYSKDMLQKLLDEKLEEDPRDEEELSKISYYLYND